MITWLSFAGWCHNDLTEQNVLVAEKPSVSKDSESHTQTEYAIVGVIDFGDIVHSCRVFDIAICMAQIMSDCLVNDLVVIDPVDCGGHILAGYSSEIELSQQERDILKECIEVRLIQGAVWGLINFQREHNNYVLQFVEKSWKLCLVTSQMDKDELYERWKTVAESYTKQ